MLILGGAATVTALCGMNIYAASFLIPFSTVPFTLHGAASESPAALARRHSTHTFVCCKMPGESPVLVILYDRSHQLSMAAQVA